MEKTLYRLYRLRPRREPIGLYQVEGADFVVQEWIAEPSGEFERLEAYALQEQCFDNEFAFLRHDPDDSLFRDGERIDPVEAAYGERSVFERFFDEQLSKFGVPALGIHGVDYYGLQKVRQRLGALSPDDQALVVTFLFVDALIDAALRTYAPSCRRRPYLVRPPFILNGDNILMTPQANVTHCHPQLLLGLHSRWTLAQQDRVRRRTDERLRELRSSSALSAPAFAQLVRALARDEDLRVLTVGMFGPIPEPLRDAYLAAVRGVAIELCE